MFTYSQWLVDFLAKAAGHKYIKRVPYTSGGKMRYRYIYKVTHMAGGKHVLDPEHMVQGAAFMLSSAKGSEVHAHITKVDGDMVTYRLDDGPRKGELVTEPKSKLAERLNAEHGVHEALAGAREKQAKVVADLKERGASEKQVAREQARLDRLEAAAPAPAPKSEEPKKRAPKKPKSVEPKPEEPTPEKQAPQTGGAFLAKMDAARKSVDALTMTDLEESAWFPNGAQNEGERQWADMLALLRQAGPDSVSKYKALVSRKLDALDSFGLSEYAEQAIEQKIARAKYDANVVRVSQERRAAVQYVLDQEGMPERGDTLHTGAFKNKVNKELKARGLKPVKKMHRSARDYADDFDAGPEPTAKWVAPPQALAEYWYSSPLSIGARRSTYATSGVATSTTLLSGMSASSHVLSSNHLGVLDALYKHYSRPPVQLVIKTNEPRASMSPRKDGGYRIRAREMSDADVTHEIAHVIEYEVPLAGVMSGLWLASTSDKTAGVRDAGLEGYQLTGASEGAQDQMYARRVYGNLITEVFSTAFEVCANIGISEEFAKFASTDPLRAALLMAYMDGDLK